MKKYEKYQLQWMIDHGYCLTDLIKELDQLAVDRPNDSIMELYQGWEQDRGFNSEIWACQDEWAENEALEPDSIKKLNVPLLNGTLVASVSPNPEYPGIDVEYIDNDDLGESLSRPRVLIETPDQEELRCLIWADQTEEDYTDEIPLYRFDKTKPFLDCVNEIHEAIQKGILRLDPNDKDSILIYRSAGDENPEGWYSQSILEVAQELLEDKKNYAEFRKAFLKAEELRQKGNQNG